jgi:methenyltetrahydromethanopterin cyclohydrolase
MVNQLATELFLKSAARATQIGCRVESVAGAQILDAGITTSGSLQAGLVLSRLCLGNLARVAVLPADSSVLVSNNLVHVQTDEPVMACLGSQYAGWPVSTDDYFAMGSGPMRLFRGREQTLIDLGLSENGGSQNGDKIVGVLESEKLPTPSAIKLIAEQCGVRPDSLCLGVAPCTCIAGSLQVVSRSIETAMHKLHELKFDVNTVVSATGNAPLPPPAKPGDTVAGIGRTNDAMLYGATVTMWVDACDEAIEEVAALVPSCSSQDHGRPFAQIFKDYEFDFYKVDPLLFSPASVTIHSLQSGRTWSHGKIETEVLRQSFISQ